MLDRARQDEMGKGSLTPPRPTSPVDIVAKGLNKLTASDREDPVLSPNAAERPSASYGSARSREVALFMQASELERLGKVSQAIKYYEKAFRLNPDVHRLAQDENADEGEGRNRDENGRPASFSPGEETSIPPPVRPKFQPVVPGALEEISASLDSSSQEPPLGVPNEVLVRILRWLGLFHAASLEACALTCKAMYVASRQTIVWKTLYRSTRATRRSNGGRCLGESGAMGHEDRASLRPRTHATPSSTYGHSLLNYRQLYFETPRVRTDGLYICRISYFRPGLTDGAFCHPVHLVTYYRYLRFFPATCTGHVVLFVVSTEEPRTMIDLLRHPPDRGLSERIPSGVQAMELMGSGQGQGFPFKAKTGKVDPPVRSTAFRKANLFIGKCFRESPQAPSYSLVLYDPQTSSSSQGYIFSLDLTVSKSTKSAVSNVIICDRYCSLSPPATLHGPPRVHDFAVKDWGKFLFSRVRSYIS